MCRNREEKAAPKTGSQFGRDSQALMFKSLDWSSLLGHCFLLYMNNFIERQYQRRPPRDMID